VKDDPVNLLGLTTVSVLVVDSQLRIKRVTPAAQGIFNVRARDIGNPIHKIQLPLGEEDLEFRVRRVMDSSVAEECELRIRERRCHVLRIDPCHGRDDRVEGAVITAIEIDEMRQTRNAALLAARFAEAVL
jgi:two-component system CheB/CheR fusion protein